MKNEVARRLPESAQTLFYDITEYRVLGASNHIDLIGEIFAKIAQATKTTAEVAEAKQAIRQTGAYLDETRGEGSQAVKNALAALLGKVNAVEAVEPKAFSEAVEKIVREFKEDSDRNTKRILQFAAAEMGGCKKYLVFDYSSTVCKYIASLAGRDDGIEMYIPEKQNHQWRQSVCAGCGQSQIENVFFPRRCHALLS